jgi:hypothetical protein
VCVGSERGLRRRSRLVKAQNQKAQGVFEGAGRMLLQGLSNMGSVQEHLGIMRALFVLSLVWPYSSHRTMDKAFSQRDLDQFALLGCRVFERMY